MHVVAPERADYIVAAWRRIGDADNPAGPLYSSGRFAEADIISACHEPAFSGYCGTACTYSYTRQCC